MKNSSKGFDNYKWLDKGNAIPGATSAGFTASNIGGDYFIISNHCDTAIFALFSFNIC